MFSPNKLVAGLVGAGSLGAIGTAGAYYGGLFSNDEKKETIIQTVAKKLEKEGFTILDSSSQPSDWDAVLKDYKSSDSKTFLSKEEDQAHKAKCQEVLRLENSDDYSNAKRWCVKKEKMNAILKKAGFKPLKAKDEIVQNEKGEWTKKIQAIKKLSNKPFTELQEKIKEETQYTDENIKLLRAQCEKIDIETIETTNKDFESNFKLMKDWCSIKSSN